MERKGVVGGEVDEEIEKRVGKEVHTVVQMLKMTKLNR